MSSRVVLSAGSNIGDRLGFLRSVTARLGDDLVAVSDVFETDPWGGVDQDDFANVTLIADGDRDWLAFCRECEQAAQRVRDVRWGPRTLDVDVISVVRDGEAVLSDHPDLTLPHPRAHLRAFVLVPWLDVDPHAQLTTPDGTHGVADLVARLDPAEVAGVRRRGPL